MKKYSGALLLVLTTASVCWSAESTFRGMTADELLARISAEGGKRVLTKLSADEQTFDAVLRPVESGDSKWFEVWRQLRPFADAAVAESIDMGFGRALPVAPERVLRLIGHGIDLQYVCGSPFIELEPGVAKEYERKTLKALAGVRDPQLMSLAKECAARVRLTPQ